MLKNISELGIVAAVTSVSFLIPSSVYAFSLTTYNLSQFSADPAVTGSLVGVATPLAPINTATFAPFGSSPDAGNGFGGLFTENFLLVGARVIDSTIPTDFRDNANSVAITSQLVNLTAGDIASGIGLSFRFGYNGNSTGNAGASDGDNFTIALSNTLGGSEGLGRFIGVTASNYAITNSISTILTPIITLKPGDYQLIITVNENADLLGGRSTAAGFNNIQIAPVPFEFSPALGLGVLGLGFAATQLKKAQKTAK
jgi:hypothetical protein